MFERYTEKARRTIFFARYEASQFGAPAIEPEHLLLGLMREDKTLTARVLARAQASLEAIRKEIEGRAPLREKIHTSVELPLAPETKRVLAYAHEESDRLQHRHIGTEHLLLGLLREERSMAAEILYARGLRLAAVREEVAGTSPYSPLTAAIESVKNQESSELNLSNYPLVKVPESVASLKTLRRLDLSWNQLEEIPNFIGQLSQLEYLDLSNNHLSELPDSLLSLRSLKALYLHGNDALGLPDEILGHIDDGVSEPVPPISILEYYYRIRGGQRGLNEAKLILVGRGGVGKTSLVNRLVFDTFTDEKKTEGIQITKWNIRLNGDELVRLNIWDFGGQEIMHATHQFFLTHRSLYLLVLSGGREDGEEIPAGYWLNLIESFGEGSPVIVVLNKIKEHPFDVNRRALLQKYPNIRDFIKTDCEDGTGIEQLHEAIINETNQLEFLRTPFPESWFAIKEKLAVMRTSYLTFDEYRKQCSQYGEKDLAAQESLSFYLHNLGIALNYKDDPRLQDTYVLSPQWVTGGIYKILHSGQVKESGGQINLKELPDILGAENYPVRMGRFLFDLMKKFELCFSFPEDDCRYLIPELLDDQEPEEVTLFDPKECLNFQYHYSTLPVGLLPRFIVRSHVLSEGNPRWRSGVILKFEGNRAIVKADRQDKKVFISVSGNPSGRHRLLAVIRSDFESIHHNSRNLQAQAMVPLPGHPDVVIPYNKLLALENAGIEILPELAGGKVLKLSVNSLLNGVDLAGSRLTQIMSTEPLFMVRLFYSYSHKDESLRDELNTHLKLMQRQGMIKSWYDRNIDAGDDWKRSIDGNLEQADIILLLISADFIASDYCYEKEMQRALERHASGEAHVIPVIVRDVDLSGAPFAGIQYLPKDGKAITLWGNRDSAWRNVSEGIKQMADNILQKKIQVAQSQ
jgi:internalin A